MQYDVPTRFIDHRRVTRKQNALDAAYLVEPALIAIHAAIRAAEAKPTFDADSGWFISDGQGRQSVETWPTRSEASTALRKGTFTWH